MTLRQWVARAIFASFPMGSRAEAAHGARAYMTWLDSLPVQS